MTFARPTIIDNTVFTFQINLKDASNACGLLNLSRISTMLLVRLTPVNPKFCLIHDPITSSHSQPSSISNFHRLCVFWRCTRISPFSISSHFSASQRKRLFRIPPVNSIKSKLSQFVPSPFSTATK